MGPLKITKMIQDSLIHVIDNDVDGKWSKIGEEGAWSSLEDAYLYFANDGDTIRTNVTVGQGENPNLIGSELMFAHTLDEYYDEAINHQNCLEVKILPRFSPSFSFWIER